MNVFEQIQFQNGVYLKTEIGFVFHVPHLKVENQKTAFFGGWKWVDENSNCRFLDQATAWAVDQGCHHLVGPYDFSTYYSYRFKIDEFERPAFYGEPNNQKQDLSLLESCGFHSLQLFETYHFSDIKQLIQQAHSQLHGIEELLLTKNLRVQKARLADIENNLQEFFELSHNIFLDNYLYNPITFESFKNYFAYAIAPRACWDSTVFLIDELTNNRVGYCLNFRDPQFSHHLLVKSVGVLPNYRFMGSSFLGMFKKALELAPATDEKVSFCLMKAGNFPSLIAGKIQTQKQNYALFIKKLI
jgi:hypothetical protein